MNLEYRVFLLSEKAVFNSVMCSANSFIMSVVEVFIHSVEHSKLYVYLLMIARIRLSGVYQQNMLQVLRVD